MAVPDYVRGSDPYLFDGLTDLADRVEDLETNGVPGGGGEEGGSSGPADWNTLQNKPVVIAAGATQAAARAAIAAGTGTSNLALGTTGTTAKAGNYQPAVADVTGLQTALDGKQPTGAYLTSVAISDVSGLNTALAGKQPAGSYINSVTKDNIPAGSVLYQVIGDSARITNRSDVKVIIIGGSVQPSWAATGDVWIATG